MHYLLFFAVIFMLLFSFSGQAQKKELDEKAYKTWRRVDNYQLSTNGKWVRYRYLFHDNDVENETCRNTYYFYETASGTTISLHDVDSPEFFAGGDWVSYRQTDTLEGQPVSFTGIRHLKTNRSIRCPEEVECNPDYPLIAYQVAHSLIVRNIETNDSVVIDSVGMYRLYDKNWKVIYIQREPTCHRLCTRTTNGRNAPVTLYKDQTRSLDNFFFNEWDQTGNFQVATNASLPEMKDYYTFSLAGGKVTKLLEESAIADLRMDVNSIEQVGSRHYLLYNEEIPPRQRQVKGKKDERFKLQLWSWDDPVIASRQEKSGYREPAVTPAKHVYDLASGQHHRLCDAGHSGLYVQSGDAAAFAFEKDTKPYSRCQDWSHDNRYDLYLVQLATGNHQLVGKALTRAVQWSPNGECLLFFDNADLSWVLLEPRSMTRRTLTGEIPHALHDELYDRPNPAPPYGVAGWSSDGEKLIVYDRFDIWVVNVRKEKKTYCWTRETGRKRHTIFRLIDPRQNGLRVNLARENEVVSLDWTSKDGGIYALSPTGKLTPRLVGDFQLTQLQESGDGKTVLCMKQNYQDDRDLWVGDHAYRHLKKITSVNLRKEEYAWGTVRQVEWTNADGKPNQGLLYLPDGYDSTRRYPAIVSFYETHTPEIHVHPVPGFSQAMIDIPTYVSKGYVVFQPDVYIQVGAPAKSAYNAVISGTKALIDRGVIDPWRVGLQGHSWSGFLVANLVTRTDLFACVNIGAATLDLPGVYTDIREEGGISNMLMYEDWQCRMGKTLWEDLPGYIENSPLLFADKIHTPVLIFHCDQDGAVPYRDGRGLFLALRRLQRPVWLLNYMGEGHFLHAQPARADWTLRLEQFFNHYLKDAPLPRWMSEGININERGYDQKYELVD